MNEEQMKHLSKLPNHVAAVYQSDWIEPVLCEIEAFNFEEFKKELNYTSEESKSGDVYKRQHIHVVTAKK